MASKSKVGEEELSVLWSEYDPGVERVGTVDAFKGDDAGECIGIDDASKADNPSRPFFNCAFNCESIPMSPTVSSTLIVLSCERSRFVAADEEHGIAVDKLEGIFGCEAGIAN